MYDQPLLHLEYEIDKNLLLEQAKEAKKFSKPYTDSRYPGLQLDDWHIGHYTSPYIEKIILDFGIQGKARFYWLEPLAIIPEHVDNGTLCSLNFMLTGSAPITIKGNDYSYESILLNTTVPHSVTNNEQERIMLKISIFDETFEEVAERIPHVSRRN